MADKIRIYKVTSINGHGTKSTDIHPAPSKIILQNNLTTEDVRVEVKYLGWGKVTAQPHGYEETIFLIEKGDNKIEVHENQLGYGYLKQQCPTQFKEVEIFLNEQNESYPR